MPVVEALNKAQCVSYRVPLGEAVTMVFFMDALFSNHQLSDSPGRRRQLLRRLAKRLPAEALISDEEGMRPYECDGLTAYRNLPWCVVLPATVEQVRTVLVLCRELQIPVVTRGAGTGLSGGALPHSQGVLLGMSRLNHILELDPRARLARVEPGVSNLALSEAAAPHGLFYAPDPSSQAICSIGGNVAENSGGVHCLKYGLTLQNLVALKLLDCDGEVLELGQGAPDNPGYDLLALLCGSEGMLGVIIEITVRLLPRPACHRVLLAGFARVTDAAQAVAAVIGAGIIPAGLEMMDQGCIQAVEAYLHGGYPTDAAALLLCEIDGETEEVAAELRQVSEIFQTWHATSLRVARDEAESARMWAGRKAAFPAVGRLAPDYYCMDGTIPRRRIGAVLERIAELARLYNLRVVNVFHAGDGNLHPLVLYDSSRSGETERVEDLGRRILELCVAEGGTVSGEHGVGVDKLDPMCSQFSQLELAQFHAVKQAFDPVGRLNPGKAVPLLRRCAEWGGMHVHAGKDPFPGLERF